ncbi:IDEAL domain-containing protein [Marininema mesophilum]|uniref:IDEAL domain-containing protein n=1 Tax=Marininema mesophilum TaxID=1048340 RepID=A0A1H2WDI5_9BACL|nr:IDEAL domain-containing protein [Marininema mesophilum]SDW78650.1 IDEAL domain-containing protein [Marininema mesophilum]
METLLNPPLNTGDWVQGKTENDELFQGYVESIDTQRGIVHVRVIQSDNNDVLGKLFSSPMDRIRRLNQGPLDQEGYLLNLIDLALATRDKTWFMELTDLLNQLEHGTKTVNAA